MAAPPLLALALAARAAGPHLYEVHAIGGVADDGSPVAGASAALPPDDRLRAWFALDAGGGGLRHAWLEGHWTGAPLGPAPPLFSAERRRGPVVPVGWWRLGTDPSTRRQVRLERSRALLVSLPALWGVEPRRLHLGPTVGLGLDLAWWDRWRDVAEDTVMTGKVEAQAGLLAGAWFGGAGFLQGRATFHYDLFGVHQRHVDAAGAAGLFPGGGRLGLEVRGELDEGDDTVDLAWGRTWAVRGAIVWREPVPERAGAPRDDGLDALLREIERLRRELEESGELGPAPAAEPTGGDEAETPGAEEPEPSPGGAPPAAGGEAGAAAPAGDDAGGAGAGEAGEEGAAPASEGTGEAPGGEVREPEGLHGPPGPEP